MKISVSPLDFVRGLLGVNQAALRVEGRNVIAVAARVRRLVRELELDAEGCYALCGPLLEGLASRHAGHASALAGAEIVASALEREKRRRAAARAVEPLT